MTRENGMGRGMGTMLGARAMGPIGIDVDDRWLTAAQLRRGPAGWSLALAVCLPRSAEGELTSAEARDLAEALGRAGARGGDVVVGVPDSMVRLHLMELPPRSSKAPIAMLARVEMARVLRAEPESLRVGCWDVPAGDRTRGVTTVMGTALSGQAMEPSLDALEAAGLRAVVLEPRCCSLARACALSSDVEGQLVGVIDVGWNATQVMLLLREGDTGVLVSHRSIPEVRYRDAVQAARDLTGCGEDEADEALRLGADGPQLASPELDALARAVRKPQSDLIDRLAPEVQRSLTYAMQRHASSVLACVHLVGEGAGVAGLPARLAHAVGAEVRAILPEMVVGVAPHSTWGRDARLVAALGLATRGMSGLARAGSVSPPRQVAHTRRSA